MTHHGPEDLTDEIATREAESAEVLPTIRDCDETDERRFRRGPQADSVRPSHRRPCRGPRAGHTNFEIGPASLSSNRMARTEDRERVIRKFGLQSHARTTWLALVHAIAIFLIVLCDSGFQ